MPILLSAGKPPFRLVSPRYHRLQSFLFPIIPSLSGIHPPSQSHFFLFRLFLLLLNAILSFFYVTVVVIRAPAPHMAGGACRFPSYDIAGLGVLTAVCCSCGALTQQPLRQFRNLLSCSARRKNVPRCPLLSQGMHVEAAPLYDRAIAIREKVLGPENPNLAISLYFRALSLAEQVRDITRFPGFFKYPSHIFRGGGDSAMSTGLMFAGQS